MERKLKSSEIRNKHRYTPLISAFVVFIIFMTVRSIIGKDDTVSLNLLQVVVLFFAPLLIGWLIGWGIRFQFVERRYTKRGVSVPLAQFLVSLFPPILILLSLLGIYVSAHFIGKVMASDTDMTQYMATMICVITFFLTLGFSLYTRSALWLRKFFALSHLD